MPYSIVFLHYVWSTKYRNPILTPPVKQSLINHIRQYAYSQNIHIVCIDGHMDHLHCLVKLRAGQTIDGVIKLIKGESARWFNLKYKYVYLVWQSDYFVASVGKSAVESLKRYIANQEAHHADQSFEQEYQKLSGMLFRQEGTE